MKNHRDSDILELEVILCVVVGDVFHHSIEALHICWYQAFLNIVAQEVTKQTTEIFMTRIRKERAAVGEHSYETTQQTKHRKGIHLTLHSVELVIEPPTGTKLNLTGTRTILEVTKHGGNNLICAGVQCI